MSVNDLIKRVTRLEVPIPPGTAHDKIIDFALGVLNCFIFGLGMVIIGFLENDAVDMLIGVMQLLLPFVGWIWGLIWGILISFKAIMS